MSRRERKKHKKEMDEKLYREDMEKFKKQLEPNCLKVYEIEGDGNCLFRAIADQLDGDQSQHDQYRV